MISESIACVDVQYHTDFAIAAALVFNDWQGSFAKEEVITRIEPIAPYKSGYFYRRELPCITAALEKLSHSPSCIIIDGYVWLPDNTLGMGGHLYEALDRKNPIIGVAKTEFHNTSAIKINRGKSRNHLFITAAGIDQNLAAQRIKDMHGEYRIPTLLKRVDSLCRGIFVQ